MCDSIGSIRFNDLGLTTNQPPEINTAVHSAKMQLGETSFIISISVIIVSFVQLVDGGYVDSCHAYCKYNCLELYSNQANE